MHSNGRSFLGETVQLARAVGRAMGMTFRNFVRIRVDQILAISWKLLLPATLLLLMATAVVVVWRHGGGA